MSLTKQILEYRKYRNGGRNHYNISYWLNRMIKEEERSFEKEVMEILNRPDMIGIRDE